MEVEKEMRISMELAGGRVQIGRGEPFRLLFAQGLEAAQYEVGLGENALLDGGYVASERVAPREIDIEFEAAQWALTQQHRLRLIGLLRPKTAGTLTVSRAGVTRSIGFRLSGRPRFKQESLYDFLRVSVTLVCPDPYFTDPSDSAARFLSVRPLFAAPLTSWAGAGTASGMVTASGSLEIENAGDTDIGVVAELTAETRVAVNGECVRALTELAQGDSLAISTVPGQKSIRKNGEPANFYDRASVFFQLPTGRSTVTVSADTGADNLRARIRYRLKYLGV
jgi:hypothetical protein